ncbi:MAG: Asp-tRNA(Asn)/Glu-tRNA(Gln) amidotransferase subunit GatA [Deltaproteobacteria bacterium]|nr:Asp-tRNA(Asn)/Glu-tRNA(Gln) amidotransferase subunit GatA [Deltaproteobacteria bacterium]
MSDALHTQSAHALRERVAKGETSAVEIARAALDTIHTRDAAVGAFLHVDGEGALAQAAQVDRARAAGEALGPLAGVPIAMKDNLCVRGIPATCASKILEGWIAPYDATVVERLRAAGAVIVGKTNMDEFAMGSSNETSAYKLVHNPWDLSRAPGGSSGGSAASVAAGMAPLSLGSDTGGSVRQPAAFCGLVALKPTYGRVSRYGLIAFASSLDQIGPFARDVRDCAIVSEVISGRDPRDATSVDTVETLAGTYTRELERDVKGLRVGVVRASLAEGCEPGVVLAIERSIDTLRSLGCEIVDVTLPTAEHAVSAYYIVAPAECSSNLARFDGMRFGPRVESASLEETYGKTRALFGKEVRRRIMLGTYVLSAGYYDAFYAQAQKARTLISRDYAAAFERCDVVLTPTAPSVAFGLGAKTKNPLEMYLADIFTLPPSLAGLPAISVPCGLSEGLPVGLQLTAKAFDEATLFRVASAFERATDHHTHRASMFAAGGAA